MRFTPFTGPKNPTKHGKNAKVAKSTRVCPPKFPPFWCKMFLQWFRSEKLQNENFPNFSNFRPEFCPEFCSEISPNFFEDFFVLRFVGDGDQKKIHQKSLPFFNAKFPGKHEKNIHKILLESRQSDNGRVRCQDAWERAAELAVAIAAATRPQRSPPNPHARSLALLSLVLCVL